MVKPKIFFIELNVQNKFRHACDIIEKFFEKNISVTVYIKDSKNAGTLDKQLWVWKQESFIPHITLNEYSNQPEEPVIITTNETFPAVTDVLIFYDPVQSASFDKYKYIIDFAEVYNPEKLQQSRERYKKIRDAESYDLEFFKLGAFLKNFTV